MNASPTSVLKPQKSQGSGILADVSDQQMVSVSKKKMRRTAILLVVTNYIQAVLTMVVNLVLAERLGQTGYGTFRYGIVIGTFVMIFVNFGSHRSMVRDLIHAKNPAQMMSSSIALRMSMVFIALTFGLIATFTVEMSTTKLLIAWMCALAGICMALSPKGWFDVTYNMHHHAALMLLEKFAFAGSCLLWILGFANSHFLFGVGLCWLMSRVVGCCTQWWIARKTFVWDNGWNRKRIAWLFRENVWIFGAVLGGTLATQGSQLALDAVHGNRALANFGLAFSVVSLGQLFISQVDRLMAPKIAAITSGQQAVQPNQLSMYIWKFAGFSLIGSSAVAVGIFLLGPIAIRWLLSSTWEAAIPSIQWLCIWCVLLGPNLVSARFLICLRAHKLQFGLSISRGLLAVGLAPIFVTHFDAKGVAMSMLVGAVCFGLVAYTYLLFVYPRKQVA